jgi:hypothetical protein
LTPGAISSPAASLPLYGSPAASWNTIRHSILYHLDRLNVARAIRANPEARLVVTQDGTTIILKEVPA